MRRTGPRAVDHTGARRGARVGSLGNRPACRNVSAGWVSPESFIERAEPPFCSGNNLAFCIQYLIILRRRYDGIRVLRLLAIVVCVA